MIIKGNHKFGMFKETANIKEKTNYKSNFAQRLKSEPNDQKI